MLHFFDRFAGNTALQERIILGTSGFIYAFIGLAVFLLLTRLFRLRVSNVIAYFFCVHLNASALIRAFYVYSYDLPFIGPWLQIADALGLILLCYFLGLLVSQKYFNSWDTSQKIAGGFLAFHVFAMLIYFTCGYSNTSLQITGFTSILASLLLSWCIVKRPPDVLEKVSIQWRSAKTYLCLFASLPLLIYFATPAPPDRDIMLSGNLIGYAARSSGLLHANTGFGSEVWRIRYPAGLVGGIWETVYPFAARAAEGSFLMWALSWTLYVLAFTSLCKKLKLSPWLGLFTCVNITVTGISGFHGGQIQELIAYSLGIFSIIWWLDKLYIFAGLAIFSSLVTQPIVGLPFLAAAALFLGYALLTRRISFVKALVASTPIFAAMIYLLLVGWGEQKASPSAPVILLQELTPQIFLNNLLTWLPSDSLNLWWLSLIGVVLWMRSHKPKLSESVPMIGWVIGALLIDGLFGATKWMVRFHANYSSIALFQLGWVMAAAYIWEIFLALNLSKSARAALACIGGIAWISFNHFTPGFDLKPVSVFVNHSDIRLMRSLDSVLPHDAQIYNMRPPNNPFGWGEFCTGELWRPCWNHGYSFHEIASGNERGDRQQACDPKSEKFVPCLKELGFQYILLASRANSPAYSETLTQQGAKIVASEKTSYFLKID